MEKSYKIQCIDRRCGLFSDLVHAILPSIIYFKDNNIDNFHVEWKNNLYQNDSLNLYNHFFKNMKIPFNKNEKVLGVQQRKTDHYMETKILPDNELIIKTENELKKNNYDKIFFITDDSDVLELFKKHFGDMVVYNDCIRSNENTAIHYQKDLLKNNKIKLVEDVMNDSYCLGLTDYKLICNSNVSTFSLLSNYNKDKFEYIDKF